MKHLAEHLRGVGWHIKYPPGSGLALAHIYFFNPSLGIGSLDCRLLFGLCQLLHFVLIEYPSGLASSSIPDR